MSSVWVTKRPGKRGVRYLVRWIEPETGKNRSKTFRRSEDARAHEAKLRRDFATNEYFSPVKISYDAWVTQHLEDLRNSPDVDLSPKTIAGHKEALEALGRVCKPKSPLEINPKLIRRFSRELSEGSLSANTINKYIRAIRSALSYAVRDEILPANKLIGRHRLLLRPERKVPRILEIGEVVALMNTATDCRHKLTISLAYYHGLRRGEISHLRWQDVDLEVNRLKVVDRDDFHTKKRRNHTVALRRETAALLLVMGQDRVNGYVFTNPKAFYWSCGAWFPELVQWAKLDHCTLHDLRRTCNSLMLSAGVSRESAMKVLGHTSAQVNEDYYTGNQIEQQRIAIDSLPSIG